MRRHFIPICTALLLFIGSAAGAQQAEQSGAVVRSHPPMRNLQRGRSSMGARRRCVSGLADETAAFVAIYLGAAASAQ